MVASFTVTAEHLAMILDSEHFRKKLRRIAGPRYIHELGFGVLQAIANERFIVGKVGVGEFGGIESSKYDTLLDRYKRSYFLFDLHSHPSGYLAPSIISADNSSGDLCALSDKREEYLVERSIDVRPIMGVVRPSNDPIDVLFFQERTPVPISIPVLESYISMFDNRGEIPPQEIAEIIEDTSLYNALHVSFDSNNLPERTVEALRKFEFTPTAFHP